MLENLPALFEKLNPFSFSAFVAYFGLLLGLVIALLFWFRHLLRFNRTQKQKRKLNSEFRQLSDENQSLSERLAWFDNRETALDAMEASIAKEASAKLTKQRREQKSNSYSRSGNSSYKQDQSSAVHGRDSKSTSTTQTTGGYAAGGGDFEWASQPGVSPGLAAQLNDMGIRDIDHLESLSSSERESLEAKLAFEGHGWNWDWLISWKTGASTLAAGTAGAAAVAGYASSPKKQDQPGQDQKDKTSTTTNSAGSANSASSANGPDASQAGAFTSSTQRGWPSDRPAPFELKIPHNNHPEVDWSTVKGVDPKLAAEFGSLGIKNVEQLESLSPSDRELLEARLKSKGLSWDWGWLSSWKTCLAGLGGTAAGAIGWGARNKNDQPNQGSGQTEAHTADLSGDNSGDNSDETEAQQSSGMTPVRGFAAGVGEQQKAASDSGSQYSVTHSHPEAGSGGNADDSDRQNNRGEQNQADGSGETANTGLAASSSVTPFGSKPEFKDDLTLLDGIEGPQAAELQKMGIFNFTQLHNLSLEDRAKLQNTFRQRGWRLDMDQWRIASEGNTEHPSIEDIQRKAFEIYQDRDRKGFGGGERTDWEQAEWELRGNPIFSYGVPHEIDDFAILLTGVTPEARDELYRMGLYNRHQLEHLGHDARRMLTRWFAGPRFGVDLTQSFGWLGSMDSVPTDKDFGHVFAIRPTRVDDLSDINGIGGPTEHDLNRIGIYQFEQIANWNADNVVAVNELLNLDGRIAQDQWVVQAQRLVRQR